MENWRPVPGYEGLYEISDHGNVRNRHGKPIAQWRRRAWGSKNPERGNYRGVELWKNGVARNHSVHRLVLLAFRGPPPAGRAQCAHADGDPTNNRLENLRWASQWENHLDAVRHGTVQPRRPRKQGGVAKLTHAQAEEARLAHIIDGASKASLARRYGVGGTTMQRIINYHRYHQGPRP